MKDLSIDIMCIPDTRLSMKSAKSYGKLVRHPKDGLGPRAVICAGVYHLYMLSMLAVQISLSIL